MKLFIANVTQQDHDFHYRMPSNPRPMPLMQRIPAMGQIQISAPAGGALIKADIDAIADQHAQYGMVPVSELGRGRGFHGLCYSVDRPVDIETIRRGHASVREALDEKGKALRQEAAVAISSRVEEQAGTIGSDLNKLDVSIEEEKGMNGERGEMKETIRVDRNAEEGVQTTLGTRAQKQAPRPRRGGK